MGAIFPLKAIGMIGDDAEGKWIKGDCIAHNIDVSKHIRPK